MDKMFVNRISCMKCFNNRFRKRITNLCYYFFSVIKIYYALTRRHSLAIAKIIPLGLVYEKPFVFCDCNYTRTFRFLRCNSRALLVISMLFRG